MLKMMHTGQVDLTITLLFWSHKLYPSVYYENWASFLILIQDIHLGFLGAMIDHIHAHFHHQLPKLLLSHWCEAIDCDIGGGYILLQAWDSCRVVLRGKYEILRIFEMTGLYVQGHQAWHSTTKKTNEGIKNTLDVPCLLKETTRPKLSKAILPQVHSCHCYGWIRLLGPFKIISRVTCQLYQAH